MFTRSMSRPAAVLVFAAVFSAAEPQDATRALIRNVNIVDVETGKLWVSTIELEGDRIKEIYKASPGPLPERWADYLVIDGSGLYAIPGLIDAHVHWADPESYARLMLSRGVVLVREMGSATESAILNREALRSGQIPGPDMIVAGAIVDGDPPVWPFSEPCSTPEEGRAAVRKLKEAGVDFIKVYQRLSAETYLAICDEAWELGLVPNGHIPDAVSLAQVIAARHHTVEHLTGMDVDLARLLEPEDRRDQTPDMRARSIVWERLDEIDAAAIQDMLAAISDSNMVLCPTNVVFVGFAALADNSADPAELELVPGHLKAWWEAAGYQGFAPYVKAQLPGRYRIIKMAFDAGIPIIAGTDLANPNTFAGASLHRELQILANDCGLGALEALRAATLVSARELGVDDRYGSIEAGKRASIVLLEANPLENIEATQFIASVIHNGKVYDRADLQALRDEVRTMIVDAGKLPAAEVANASPLDTLNLPGEVFAKGRLQYKFSTFPAGGEEFIFTRRDGGYTLAAHTASAGGGPPPTVYIVEVDDQRRFESAVSFPADKPDQRHKYTIENGEMVTTDLITGAQVRKPAPQNAWIEGPAFCLAWFGYAAVDLAPGQSRTSQSISFGAQRPEWQALESTTTRLPDATIEVNGRTVQARVYQSDMKSEMGEAQFITWLDADGFVLKSELKFPFGSLIVTPE